MMPAPAPAIPQIKASDITSVKKFLGGDEKEKSEIVYEKNVQVIDYV